MFGRGRALRVLVDSPCHDNRQPGAVPYLETVARRDDGSDTLTVRAVNRHMQESLILNIDLRSVDDIGVVEHRSLEQENHKATSSIWEPDNLLPHTRGNASINDRRLSAELPGLSWNVIRLARRATSG